MSETKGLIEEKQVYYILVICIYLFVFRDFIEQNIEMFGYFDELFAAMAVPIFLIRLCSNPYVKKYNIGFLLIPFLGIGLFSNAIWNIQNTKAVLADAFICVKFWFAMYTGYYLFINIDLKRNASKISFHVKLITIFLAVLTVLDYVFKIFPADIRYGIRSARLFYTHSTFFATVCVFLIGILVALSGYAKNFGYVVVLAILVCTTLRSKSLAAVALLGFLYVLIKMLNKKINIKLLLPLGIIMVIIAWRQIVFYFYTVSGDSARYQLMIKAFQIADDYFPLGTGFATFASHYSGKFYSDLYYKYGLSEVHGLEPLSPNYVSDTFWPMILGQTGIFGTIIFFLILILLYSKIQKMFSFEKNFYLSAIFLLLYILIVSFAESAFVHPGMIPIAMWMGMLIAQAQEKTSLDKDNY